MTATEFFIPLILLVVVVGVALALRAEGRAIDREDKKRDRPFDQGGFVDLPDDARIAPVQYAANYNRYPTELAPPANKMG